MRQHFSISRTEPSRGTGIVQPFRRLLRDESGAATVEFVIWVPGFMFLLMFFLDVSLYFATRTDLMRATREAARYVAVGALEPEEVDEYLSQAIGRSVGFTAVVSGKESVVIHTTLPIADASIFGIITLMGEERMELNVVVRREITTDDVETGLIGTPETS